MELGFFTLSALAPITECQVCDIARRAKLYASNLARPKYRSDAKFVHRRNDAADGVPLFTIHLPDDTKWIVEVSHKGPVRLCAESLLVNVVYQARYFSICVGSLQFWSVED